MSAIGLGDSGRRLAFVMALLIASATLFGCGSEIDDSGTSGERATGVSEPEDRSAPTTPLNLTATAVSPSRINLSWSASSDDVSVTGYRVYRGGALLTTLSTATSYQDTTASPSTTYSYTVQALDGAGNASGQSTAVIVTTPAILDTIAPSTPTGVTATAVSLSQINLSWSASTDNVAVTGYRIVRNGVP
jgi:chitodextrinase